MYILEIQKYYQNEPRFNAGYCRDNLPEIKDGAYVINPDGYSDNGTDWVDLYVQNNDVIYLILLEKNIFQNKLRTLSVIKK